MVGLPWLQGLRERIGARPRRRVRQNEHDRRTQLQRHFEKLEDRTLLAATVQFTGAGLLRVLADSDESISIGEDTTFPGRLDVQVNGVSATNLPTATTTAQVTSIEIIAGAGDNIIDLSGVNSTLFTGLTGPGTTVSIVGGQGNDLIIAAADIGTSIEAGDGDDTLSGGSGADILNGDDGDDNIAGGSGDDTINAGDGNDLVTADAGDDSIFGEDGEDTIFAGAGNDFVSADDGNDSVLGEAGNDTLNGMAGNDTLVGDVGDDSLLGGAGDDSMDAGDGDDQLLGNAGNDTAFGGLGNDTVNGHSGQDSLSGDDGDDRLNGGSAADTLDGGNGNDTLLGGSGSDRLVGDGENLMSLSTGNDLLRGQGGNDTLIGTRGADTLEGGAGDDLVRSTVESGGSVAPPPPPPPPVPPMPPPPMSTPFDDAVNPGGGASLGTSAVLSTGMGDGTLQVTVDGDGTLSSVGYDPLGAEGLNANLEFISETFSISINGGPRQVLTSGGATLTGTGTAVTSMFSQAGLNFTLTQQAEPFQNALTNSMGGMVTQTYVVTNPGGANVTFDFARSSHYHVSFPGGPFGIGSGARLVDSSGVELLLQPAGVATLTTLGSFLGITSLSGTALPTNRFEVSLGPSPGVPFNDTVFNDPDADGFSNTTGHPGLGLRSEFVIPAGGSITYTQHLFAATAQPPVPNVLPVAVGDTAQTFDAPVTIDVVSNDSDADGALDFSTVQIETQPANGTAVSLGDGRITYTPNAQFNGTDTFTYSIADNEGGRSGPATVSVQVISSDGIGDTLVGGNGSDTLIGSNGNDSLVGGDGRDSLDGMGGNDTLLGGSSPDTLNGGSGDDVIDGQGGDDVVNGDEGEDTLIWGGAGDGDDTLVGGSGSNRAVVEASDAANTLVIGQSATGELTVTEAGSMVTVDESVVTVIVNGNNGNDTITLGDVRQVGRISLVIDGGIGDDTINAAAAQIGSVRLELRGGEGADTINGSDSADIVSGGAGDDFIVANGGADTIDGDAGADVIDGGAGNDSIRGGADDDTIDAGAGDDTVDGGLDNDAITGGDGDDSLRGNFGDDNLNGNSGNDTLLGQSGQDTLSGGSGGDLLNGGRNNDRINGQSGNDSILGDHGDDSITGGGGNDEILGGDGDDSIEGGAGNDGIDGGNGNDLLDGNTGNDVIRGDDGDDTIRGGGGADTMLGDQGVDVLNGNGGDDLGQTGEGVDPAPTATETIDEQFTLTAALLARLDAM